jgi:hypothetical protein
MPRKAECLFVGVHECGVRRPTATARLTQWKPIPSELPRFVEGGGSCQWRVLAKKNLKEPS